MKRLAVLFATLGLIASPAFATNEFALEWKNHYLTAETDEEFTKTARKTNCNICHVKGGKKTEHNEYGKAVKEFLKKDDFTKEKLKANPELAKQIVEGLKKAGEKTSSDGKTFAAKIAAGSLPATDAGL